MEVRHLSHTSQLMLILMNDLRNQHTQHTSLTATVSCAAADPLAVNDDALTPLDLARNRGHITVVRMIEVFLRAFSCTTKCDC